MIMKRLIASGPLHRKSMPVVLSLALLLLGPLLIGCTGALSVRQPVTLPSPADGVAYGVNVDITAMIPNTPYTVQTPSAGNFFDLAARLGINTLRVTDVLWSSAGQEQSQASWQYVFNQAERYHMKIILLLDGSDGYSALDQAHVLLDQYGLARSPALWLIDLDNEPDISNAQEIAALREEAAYIRQVLPKVLLTIGGWKSEIADEPGQFNWQDPADIPSFIDLVDIVAPHLYQFDQGAEQGFTPQQWTQRFLSEVRKQAQGKPILLEEFGAGNGLAPTTQADPTGSLQWQASVYQGVLQEVAAEHNQDVVGAVSWIFAPRPAWPNCNCDEGDMTGWSLVLDHGQRLLPAAQTFAAVALAHGK